MYKYLLIFLILIFASCKSSYNVDCDKKFITNTTNYWATSDSEYYIAFDVVYNSNYYKIVTLTDYLYLAIDEIYNNKSLLERIFSKRYKVVENIEESIYRNIPYKCDSSYFTIFKDRVVKSNNKIDSIYEKGVANLIKYYFNENNCLKDKLISDYNELNYLIYVLYKEKKYFIISYRDEIQIVKYDCS